MHLRIMSKDALQSKVFLLFKLMNNCLLYYSIPVKKKYAKNAVFTLALTLALSNWNIDFLG